MDVMQVRAVPGSSLQLLGDVTDLDDHQVKVEFPHERVDSFKTTFGTRAFEDSFREQLPIMVWAHDLRDPIGRGIRAQVLPKHNEVVGRFSDLDAVPSAKRAHAQITDGTITDFSFGYIDGPEVPHPDPQLRRRGVRQIPRATMREFSPVSIGSIPGAKVAGIREDGNLVTVDSPESVARLVELKVISPEEGNQLLRSFGLLGGTRAAPAGGPWTVADAVAHLQEAHGIDVYQAGLGNLSPETLAIMHEQVGTGFHDHGPWQGWLASIAASMAYALQNGTMLQTPVDQEASNAAASGSGYSVQGGAGGLPPFGRQGDDTPAVPAVKVATVNAAGYQAQGGAGGGRSVTYVSTRAADEPIRADHVMSLIEQVDPEMALRLREDGQLALAPAHIDILFRDADGAITDGSGEPVSPSGGEGLFDEPAAAAPEASELALNVEAALDSARQWLDGADIGSLPEEVQQALALVSAAADGSDALVDVLGGQRGERADSDGDNDFSDTPWSDFDESDYSPEQWRSACLIDTGKGGDDSKDRYALPVKEPSGKLNKHGISAAASRISQVKGAPDDEVKKAARRLMALHGQMKKPTPPNVLKVLGKGERADEEELKAAEELLNARLAQRAAK